MKKSSAFTCLGFSAQHDEYVPQHIFGALGKKPLFAPRPQQRCSTRPRPGPRHATRQLPWVSNPAMTFVTWPL